MGIRGYQYVNQEVQITQETRNGEYVLAEQNGNRLGWIDRRALRLAQMGHPNHSKEIHSFVRVTASGYSVDTLPWGTPGHQRITRTSQYLNRNVMAVRQTNNKEYYLLAEDSGRLIGWVDHRAISPTPERILNGRDLSFNTVVGSGGFTIGTLPWGTTGYQRIGNTTDYVNQTVRVVQETRNKEYVLIERDNHLIGWIDRRALRLPQEGNPRHSTAVNYKVSIAQSGFSIDTLPWGTPGYQRIDRTNNYVGREARAVRRTNNEEYILLEFNGSLLGWVDHRAIEASYDVGVPSNSFPVD